MSKRRGENRQLRPEEVEAQEAEESVEAGVFQRASEEQLQKRKIVSVKRKKRPAAATAAPAPASLGGSASVGASFAGALHTGNGADSSPAASLLNPFQGFSALTPSAPSSAAKAGAASTSTSAPFSFGALGGGGGGGGAKEKAAGGAATGAGGVVVAGGGGFSFGARPSLPVPAKPSPSPAAPPGSSGSGSGSVSFSADTLGGGSGSFSAKPRPPSTPGPKSGGGGGGRGTEGDTAMTRLNSTFRRWVTAQASSKPLSSWAEGLRDYATHAERLRAKHSGSGGGSRAGEGAKEARAAIPALGSGTGPSEYPVTPGLSFGSSLAVPTPASGGGGSGGGGGNAKNTPSSVGFSFNAPANFFSAPAAPRAAAAAGGGGGSPSGVKQRRQHYPQQQHQQQPQPQQQKQEEEEEEEETPRTASRRSSPRSWAEQRGRRMRGWCGRCGPSCSASTWRPRSGGTWERGNCGSCGTSTRTSGAWYCATRGGRSRSTWPSRVG